MILQSWSSPEVLEYKLSPNMHAMFDGVEQYLEKMSIHNRFLKCHVRELVNATMIMCFLKKEVARRPCFQILCIDTVSMSELKNSKCEPS